MSELERAIRRLRADLLAKDAQASSEMLFAYGQVYDRLGDRIDLLAAEMEAAKRRGETLSQSWLLRENRLQALLGQTRDEMNRFAQFAEARVVDAQRRAVQQAQSDAQILTLAGLEDAEKNVVSVSGTWNRLPTETITEMVGMLQDGSPLRSLFDNFGYQASTGIRQALVAGLALGSNPRVIAREIREVLDIGHTRAQTIARTETLRAYRSASLKTYEENADVVTGWRWFASLSTRTCALCIAMHGKLFPLTQSFGSHPNCRCVCIPVVEGAPEVATGEDWFQAQPPETQESILGIKAAQAYRAGEVTLADFVGVAQSDRWGTTRYVVSLEEARSRARLRPAPAPAPVPAPKVSNLPSVATGYTLPKSGKYKEIAETALKAIDVVHSDGDLPTIPVETSRSKSYHGAYARLTSGKSHSVKLSAFGDHLELTFCHETGHYLDWEVLGPKGKWGSHSPEFDGIGQAIENSRAVAELKTLLVTPTVKVMIGGKERIYPVDRNYLRYLLKNEECWARAYAQYIAMKSKDPTLTEQLRGLLEQKAGTLYYPSQWEEDDFAPIAAEIDKLFAGMGWLR